MTRSKNHPEAAPNAVAAEIAIEQQHLDRVHTELAKAGQRADHRGQGPGRVAADHDAEHLVVLQARYGDERATLPTALAVVTPLATSSRATAAKSS